MIRKGLTKFYDIKVDFINDQRYNEQLFQKNGGVFTTNELNMRNYTLGPLYDILSNNQGSVTILKTLKANGENAQISFVPEIQSWSISSKNVCLLARQDSDVDQNYNSDRFHFAKLMAHTWFDLISTIPPKDLAKLK